MLIGHQRIWNFLTQSAAKNRLAHAYLFVGASQVGKKTLALEFAKWLLCQKKITQQPCNDCRSCLDIDKNQHPDIFVLSPRQEEKRGVTKTFEIGIEEVRALQHQLSLFSYSSQYKIAIIDEVAALTREATNSFLKTLEEPTRNSLIILISSSWQALLPTIISRCQLIKFLPVAEKEILGGLKSTAKSVAPQRGVSSKFSFDGGAEPRTEGQHDKYSFITKSRRPSGALGNIDLSKIAKLAAGRPGRAIKLLEDSEILNQQQANAEIFGKILKSDLIWRWDLMKQLSQDLPLAQEFLSQWLLWLRNGLLKSSGCNGLMIDEFSDDKSKYFQANVVYLIKEIQKTQAILNNSGFNSRLALEVLMLKI